MHGGGWPAMETGAAVLTKIRNINVGLAGFIDAAQAKDWDLVPTIWCAASPSAHVRKDAYERIATAIVDGIAAAGKIDGVYLDLHGAMVTEHFDDGEGELLARVRKVIGRDLPLVVSLDLHANITPAMVEHADALVAYRTYPHIDMADTGRAAARHMALLLGSTRRFAKAFRQLPFLIPISWQCTSVEPCKSIYAHLASLENEAVPTLSFAPGFPAADFPDCGPVVVAYGKTQGDADKAADTICKLIADQESAFDGRIFAPDEGVVHAMALAATATKPIVIADTQDNPGAGGDSDTTGMLRALLKNGAKKPPSGSSSIRNPRVPPTQRAPVAPSRSRSVASRAFPVTHRSRRASSSSLSDGRFVAPGPYFGGSQMNLGPSACLRIGDVRIVVGSRKAQLADQAMFRFVGIEPTAQSILVNKSSVHFRADFEPIAEQIIVCAAPGAMPADTAALPWTRLRTGVRIRPNGPAFKPQ